MEPTTIIEDENETDSPIKERIPIKNSYFYSDKPSGSTP
jgi:hypothetical protein